MSQKSNGSSAHCQISFLAVKMQELEQRMIEAEQRAENAEKQVRGSPALTFL